MTSAARRTIQSSRVAKVCAGMSAAAVAAVAAVTYGYAGTASACTPSETAPFTSCAYVLNNTGYTVYSFGGTSTPGATITSGATFQASVVMGDEVIYTFTMPENANTAASAWSLVYDYESSEFPSTVGFTSGSAPYPASFGWFDNRLTEKGTGTVMLTLGQNTHSFGATGLSLADPSVGQVGHIGETPNYSRGSIITKNNRAVKIWNPRTRQGGRVVSSLVAPVSSVATDSPVASSIPTQAPSAAKASSGTRKLATNRAAARR